MFKLIVNFRLKKNLHVFSIYYEYQTNVFGIIIGCLFVKRFMNGKFLVLIIDGNTMKEVF